MTQGAHTPMHMTRGQGGVEGTVGVGWRGTVRVGWRGTVRVGWRGQWGWGGGDSGGGRRLSASLSHKGEAGVPVLRETDQSKGWRGSSRGREYMYTYS